ncbi:hypothetical protein [Anaeromyxobacter terrae]|uniref:hypothetical protein n=1 Tax=Anaeromyxobacter terrae TaxID=2925406 RepID=UPI001F57A22E|nr:hypothetical protein [Anaeromyxobacter sp. SG22]
MRPLLPVLIASALAASSGRAGEAPGAAPERAAPKAAPAQAQPKAAARHTDPRASVERRREEIARELVRLGGELQRAIEAEDVAAVVARVPPDGLRCGERVVPRERVERDLRSEGSWLHGVFFGGQGHVPFPGMARSLRAFFREASEVAVLVAFRRDARAGAVGLPCIDYRAPGLGTPGAPLCFERRDGRWWFTESPYPCR